MESYSLARRLGVEWARIGADMMGPIARYLADDHARLDALLTRSASDAAAYADFRKGLLCHIGMEETLLLPAAQRARAGGAVVRRLYDLTSAIGLEDPRRDGAEMG